MGIMKGALTARRYIPQGELPPDFRESFAQALRDNAWKEPASRIWSSPVIGWCSRFNMNRTGFEDLNEWLVGSYLIVNIRRSEKRLNKRRLRAILDERIAAWCEQQKRERCPSKIKAEIKEGLTEEMMLQTMPSDAITELAWDIERGIVYLGTTAEGACDTARTLFRTTFGLALQPMRPLHWISSDPELVAIVECGGLSNFTGGTSLDEEVEDGE